MQKILLRRTSIWFRNSTI